MGRPFIWSCAAYSSVTGLLRNEPKGPKEVVDVIHREAAVIVEPKPESLLRGRNKDLDDGPFSCPERSNDESANIAARKFLVAADVFKLQGHKQQEPFN